MQGTRLWSHASYNPLFLPQPECTFIQLLHDAIGEGLHLAQVAFAPDGPVAIVEADLVGPVVEVLHNPVLVLQSPDRPVDEDRVLGVQVDVDGVHAELPRVVQQQLRDVLGGRLVAAHHGHPRAQLLLLEGQLPQCDQIVVDLQVLYHGGGLQLATLLRDVHPQMRGVLCVLVLQGLYPDLRSFPRVNRNTARNGVVVRVVLLQLHAIDLRTPHYQAYLDLLTDLDVLLDQQGMEGRDLPVHFPVHSLLFHPVWLRIRSIIIITVARILPQSFVGISYKQNQMSNWKTSNQQYGSQHGRSSSGPKTKIGRSTHEYLESLDKGNFVHEQEKIAQKQRHGLFTQPLGLSPGDLYQDAKPDQPLKRVEVNQRMQQKVGPQLFEKMGSTNIGDPYKDQFRAQQLYLKQKTDISIHPTSFMAGGKQKLVKHSQFEHKKQFDDKTYNTRDANGNVIVGKKGILTNNMKKGYGNTTAGHLFSHYPYQGYPEQDGREMDSNEKLVHKAKIPDPFKGGSHPLATFTDDFALYNKSEPYNPIKDDELYRGKSGGKWNYNNPNKKGYNGTFEKFPKYIDQGEKKKQPIREEPIWIPNFNGTSKNVGETLAKPCPAPSQLTLNELRHARA